LRISEPQFAVIQNLPIFSLVVCFFIFFVHCEFVNGLAGELCVCFPFRWLCTFDLVLLLLNCVVVDSKKKKRSRWKKQLKDIKESKMQTKNKK